MPKKQYTTPALTPLSATRANLGLAVWKYLTRRKLLPVKDKIVSVRVDDRWSFAVNGFSKPMQVIPPSGRSAGLATVAPSSVYVEFHGFPAAMFSVNAISSVFAFDSLANEAEFVKALEAAAPADRPGAPTP